jgi:hypothetical protein
MAQMQVGGRDQGVLIEGEAGSPGRRCQGREPSQPRERLQGLPSADCIWRRLMIVQLLLSLELRATAAAHL